MDKVDTLRIHVSMKDMINIEYSLYGFPVIIMKLFSILTCESLDTFALRKAEQIYMPKKLEMLKAKLEKVIYVDEIT